MPYDSICLSASDTSGIPTIDIVAGNEAKRMRVCNILMERSLSTLVFSVFCFCFYTLPNSELLSVLSEQHAPGQRVPSLPRRVSLLHGSIQVQVASRLACTRSHSMHKILHFPAQEGSRVVWKDELLHLWRNTAQRLQTSKFKGKLSICIESFPPVCVIRLVPKRLLPIVVCCLPLLILEMLQPHRHVAVAETIQPKL